MIITWDSRKAASNLRKHGVEFRDAATVFEDVHSTTYRDPDSSEHEHRFVTIGKAASGRLLFVAFAEIDEETLRVISARRATRRERKVHEEESEA